MNGNELIRRLRKLARKTGQEMTIDTKRGKGSHVRVTLGGRGTTVPIDVPRGTLRAILRQLGIAEKDL